MVAYYKSELLLIIMLSNPNYDSSRPKWMLREKRIPRTFGWKNFYQTEEEDVEVL